MTRRIPEWGVGLGFVSPWIVGFLVFLALPIGLSFYYSLTDYSMLEPPVYVGLDNYEALGSDRVFWKSVWNTVFFAALSLPITTVVSILLAVLPLHINGTKLGEKEGHTEVADTESTHVFSLAQTTGIDLGEMLIVRGTMTEANRLALVAYLTDRWGTGERCADADTDGLCDDL